jgi:signal peptidase I
VCFSFLIILFGCQSITDDTTPKEPIQVDDTSSYLVVEHHSESMDRGNNEYEGTIVINEEFYYDNSFARGEVVYFETPEFDKEYSTISPSEYSVARIIGLPGESIEIEDGQVFIDNKRLDAFYGTSLKEGLTEDEFLAIAEKFLEVPGTTDHASKDLYKELFSIDMDEITLSENELFIIGDNGPHSMDRGIFGPIATDEIVGKVIGEQ